MFGPEVVSLFHRRSAVFHRVAICRFDCTVIKNIFSFVNQELSFTKQPCGNVDGATVDFGFSRLPMIDDDGDDDDGDDDDDDNDGDHDDDMMMMMLMVMMIMMTMLMLL
jgi:hypothetical protein